MFRLWVNIARFIDSIIVEGSCTVDGNYLVENYMHLLDRLQGRRFDSCQGPMVAFFRSCSFLDYIMCIEYSYLCLF
jgi:hypothetical protein